ncbi:chaperone protein ClpB1 [Setaria italica]|uniref:chaperone protein ClpB1 n=1 Tax=Setaria italica TaxID=4555 RepID=UPI000350ADE2|nr:chaperone protein ClpB1 [Setaria italica]
MSRSLANTLGRIDNLAPPRMPLLLSGDRRHAAPAADLSQTSAGVRESETMASVSRVATASSSSSQHYAFQLAAARALATEASSRNARSQAPSPATAPSSTVPAALGAVPRETLYVQSAAQSGSMVPANVSWAAAQLGRSGPVFTLAAPKPQAPALEVYGRDMTAEAGNTDPVVGRDDVIDRVICVLCRRSKNSAVLVGAPGVGKTAVAEGLAQRIAAGNVPAALSGARVVELDLGAVMVGTTARGMVEERVRNVIKEAEDANGKVILFIDEMHLLLGVGANLLKPALARGRIRCVGATTFDEHRKYVERDTAFERRFQKVHVPEPSLVATVAILQGLKKKFEEHHNTIIQDAAISAAVRLANRYITGRQFPDKAIDVIDEASAITRIQADNQLKGNNTHHSPVDTLKEAIVCPDQVAQVVSQFTGIPVNALAQDEKVKLMNLANRLQERVVGQEEAVNLVAQSVLRSRAGLDQPGQPIGSFLFLGSTGVGKTELAKALAEQLFDSEKMLIRFDMTEFVGSHSVLRLIGAPPSYHGYEEGGQLTEKVRQRPYSVILFDEIEKADPATFNVFLQLLDDGVLTDGKGRTVDFKNTIIIMTSNLGAEYLMKAMTGGKSMEAARELVIKQAEKHFKPEFLNRLSEIVIFEPLSQDNLRVVAYVQMKGIIARLADKGINISVSEAAIDVVLSESYNPLYGARPIRRWLQKNVMTKLSEMLVKGEVDADTTVIIDASEDMKDLRYIVKNARCPYKRPPLEISSDSDSDNDIDLNAPIEKKMKWI